MNSDFLRKYLFIENSNKVGKKYYHNNLENYVRYYDLEMGNLSPDETYWHIDETFMLNTTLA